MTTASRARVKDAYRHDARGRVQWLRSHAASATSAPLAIAAVVQLGAGVVTSKLAAALIGAAGVGVLAVVQALGNFMAVLPLGTGQAVVREHQRDPVGSLQVRRLGMEVVTFCALAAFCIPALVFAHPISRVLFGDGEPRTFVLAIGGGAAFTWMSIQVSTLIAARSVRRLAIALVISAISTPVVAAVGYAVWGRDGIGPVAFVSLGLSLLSTTCVMRWTLGRRSRRELPFRDALLAIPQLLRFGVPHMLGTAVATLTLLVLPVLARRDLGIDSAGFLRASITIAVGMATIFGFVLGGDFAARIAAASRDRTAFGDALATQLHVLVRGAGLTCVALALSGPVLVPLLYSGDFEPAITILPAVLCAQLLYLVGTTVLYAVAARDGSMITGAAASLAGICTIVLCAATARVDLERMALGYVGGQALLVVLAVAALSRRDRALMRALAGARTVLALVLLTAGLTTWSAHRPIGAALSVAGVLISLPTVRRQ
jgi:O-antigen/teichoic acid export membrane protein